VFYGPDFITITKDEEAQWALLKAEVYSLITEALNSGEPVVLEGTMESSDTKREEGDSEVVGMIKELLETRIRPAIQEGEYSFVCSFLGVSGLALIYIYEQTAEISNTAASRMASLS